MVFLPLTTHANLQSGWTSLKSTVGQPCFFLATDLFSSKAQEQCAKAGKNDRFNFPVSHALFKVINIMKGKGIKSRMIKD